MPSKHQPSSLSVSGNILALIAYVVVSVPRVMLTAFIAQQLWTWFITPFGVMVPKLAHMMGLLLIVALYKISLSAAQDPTRFEKTFWEATIQDYIASTLIWLFVWGLGYIYHSFM